jgi:uncharacterized membrane protein
MSARCLLALAFSVVEVPDWLPAWISSYPYLMLLVITCIPYIELRGSIPVGVGLGLDPVEVFAVCTIANVLIILPIFLFLDFAYDKVLSIGWVKRNIEGKVESARRAAKRRVERYGYLGLAAFVAIPLPGTGAYSGCLASFLLDMERRRSILAISLGVVVAGILVSLASVGIFSALTSLGTAWGLAVLALAIAGVLLAYYLFRIRTG